MADTLFDLPALPDAPKVSAGQRITIRNREALDAGRHPANGLAIDGTHTCGGCTHLQANGRTTRTFYKCAFHRFGTSHSAASDIRASWPACPHYSEVGA